MENKEFLNEEKYKKTKRKMNIIAILALIIGISIAGTLIYNGVKKPNTEKLDNIKANLETKRKELEEKGINICADYTCGEGYDLYIIDKVLDPAHEYCSFREFKNNSISQEYCAEKNKSSETVQTAYIMGGVFSIMITIFISGNLFFFTKRREMLAFSAQQVMPIAQEGMDKMTPSVGKIAKEITKGVKEGMKDKE